MTFEEIQGRLRDPVQDKDGSLWAFCPCHADGTKQGRRSLHVSEKEGKLLIHCFAGCKFENVFEKLEPKRFPRRRQDPRTVFQYRNEQGALVFEVLRFTDGKNGKTFKQRRPDGEGGWKWNIKGIDPIPYRLPEMRQAINRGDTVFVVEGEKCVEALREKGLTATCNSGGANKWHAQHAKHLCDADVAILPDNDAPGRKHALSVAESLWGLAKSVRIVELPELPDKGDIVDWLAEGHETEELLALLRNTPQWKPTADLVQNNSHDDEQTEKRPSQADRLVKLIAEQKVLLFHNRLQEPHAAIYVDKHREVRPIKSVAFKRWATKRFYEEYGKVPNSEALRNGLRVIEAQACFDGPSHELYNRVALQDGKLYYDLANASWQVVEISKEGWKIIDSSPVFFRRYDHQCEEVSPKRGGTLKDVLPFVNIQDEDSQILFSVSLVAEFVPDMAHPISIHYGEQGSAKSYAAKIRRRIVDPAQPELLSFPKDPAELVQKLAHHWCAYFDNISSLPDWVSDTLCRAVTGEGFSKRRLYTDDDDVIFSFQRCVSLNGINVAAHKPDLLDRSILFSFERIPKNKRKTEQELNSGFERVRPFILGAVFDALSMALRTYGEVRLDGLTRLGDFAVWGSAISGAIGYGQEKFMAALWDNMGRQNREALQAHPVGPALLHFLEGKDEWEGTPTKLLELLESAADDLRIERKRSKTWPKAPNVLTRRLNEVRTNLREEGWEMTIRHVGDRRIMFRKDQKGTADTVQTVQASRFEESQGFTGDDTMDGTDDVPNTASTPKCPKTKALDGADGKDAFSRDSAEKEKKLREITL